MSKDKLVKTTILSEDQIAYKYYLDGLEKSEIMKDKYDEVRTLFEETLIDVAHMNVRILALSLALSNIEYDVVMGCLNCEKHTLIAEAARKEDDEYCEKIEENE